MNKEIIIRSINLVQTPLVNIYDNIAIAMGNYYFTDLEGVKTKVEYTFVYKQNNEGDLKIILHHSSLPYTK